MSGLLQDVRYGWRQLRNSGGFALAAMALNASWQEQAPQNRWSFSEWSQW